MKFLHSADWHLDSPMTGRSPQHRQALRRALLGVPEQVVRCAKAQGCDLLVLSGDLFDGPATPESLDAVKLALRDAQMPVFIAPGNHDYAAPGSCYTTGVWPENVHIFLSETVESVALPQLDCRVYGAGFRAPYSPGLLEGFRADCAETYAIGVFHGDPGMPDSPYSPVTHTQAQESGLDYLALGHIHKTGSFLAGSTLCAWPGCPMGRGFDEPGEKGVLCVTLDGNAQCRFLPLDTPRFFQLEVPVGDDPLASLREALPATGSGDCWRIDLTGDWDGPDPAALCAGLPGFPNLILRDRTQLPLDLWANAGEDSLEGVYFRLLREALEDADETRQRQIRLAADISRKLLEGREVKLP